MWKAVDGNEKSGGSTPCSIALWCKTRSGSPCRNPPVKGKRRCRMHGGAAGSGAPVGNVNALKHGYYSADSIAERRQATQLLNDSYDFLSQLEDVFTVSVAQNLIKTL